MPKQHDDYLDPRPRQDHDGGLDPIPQEELLLLTRDVPIIVEQDLLSAASQALLWGVPAASLALIKRADRVPPAQA